MNPDPHTVTSKRIMSLDSTLVQSALKIQSICAQRKIPFYVSWGRRSWEEQELLFRFGRSIPGERITNHRPGFSAHNYGLALDFCLMSNRELIPWRKAQLVRHQRITWISVIKLFEQEGWESGLRWPSYKPGHVEKLNGRSIRELYDEHQPTSGFNRNQHLREQGDDQGIHL